MKNNPVKTGRARRFIGLCLGLMMLICLTGCAEEEPVVTVGSRKVYAPQVRMYLYQTLRNYERLGGKEIWQMRIGGQDAFDAACDAAMASLLQTRTVLEHLTESQAKLTQQGQEEVAAAAERLTQTLGEERLKQMELTPERVFQMLEEDYVVSQFLTRMSYIPDLDEVEKQTEEYFAWYDMLDVSEYMQRIRLDAIFIYTGQWMDGEWVSYSLDARAEQLAKAENAMDQLTRGAEFREVRDRFTEEAAVEDIPPLNVGVVRETTIRDMFFKGQLERDLWENVFRIPEGEISGILTTDYGFLIVKVLAFPAIRQRDTWLYHEKLEESREAFRATAIEEQKGRGIEDLIREWQSDLQVTVDKEQWRALTSEMAKAWGIEVP